MDFDNLKDKYIRVRNQSLRLCETLAKEDFVAQPTIDVSPPKWHLAHTTWFFENLLLVPYDKNYKVFHPDYSFLFNSYYETLGERVIRPNRGNMTRPTVDEIYSYRRYVDQQMIGYFENHDGLPEQIKYIIEIGLHHEQQHQELLVTDIKYILGHNPLFPLYMPKQEVNTINLDKGEKYIDITEGIYEIGYQGNKFFYDNEKGVHKVFINGFKMLDRLVTNGEYMEFMSDGGYGDFRHWLMEGWDWVKQNHIQSPLYWHQTDGKWHYYTLNGFEEVDPREPVTHINYYEANAYANWKGKRLLTEFEWEVAAKKHYPVESPDGNFVENESFRPIPREGQSLQMFGDVWEWTGSAYLAYPGYTKSDGALGEYNGKFMVNQMTLRGGSCATPSDHIRYSYRNFFHPHLRWQFTGIRLAIDL
jgi:ergothioneine biosynthesis protein EgtB